MIELTEAEYVALQQTLQENPEAGKVVAGSGGVRKIRWAAPGRGKSGGYRVIYFVNRAPGVILMLTMSAKNVKDNIPGHLVPEVQAVEHYSQHLSPVSSCSPVSSRVVSWSVWWGISS